MPAVSPTSQRPAPPPLRADHALFLDIDGCLIDFADTPDGVVVPPTLLQTLPRVAEVLDGALALISGRVVASIDALFTPLLLPAAGQHGLERRAIDGARHDHAHAARDAAFDAVLAEARRVIALHPGTVLEDKRMGFALHWRRAPEAGDAMRAFADTAAQRLDGFGLQPGNHVIEVKPQGADKGTAIEAFLDETPFRGRTPVFLGDDLTDEDGFDVVNARGGISVLIGARGDSAARYHLHGPSAVARWLDALLATAPTP